MELPEATFNLLKIIKEMFHIFLLFLNLFFSASASACFCNSFLSAACKGEVGGGFSRSRCCYCFACNNLEQLAQVKSPRSFLSEDRGCKQFLQTFACIIIFFSICLKVFKTESILHFS